jgi:hypothetical protein
VKYVTFSKILTKLDWIMGKCHVMLTTLIYFFILERSVYNFIPSATPIAFPVGVRIRTQEFCNIIHCISTFTMVTIGNQVSSLDFI